MIDSKEYIENFESIFDEMRFASNSIVRLKILATLYFEPSNMKDLAENTKLSYSSISSNMHELELRNFVYREFNKYFLSNSARIRVRNVLEFKGIMSLLNDFFNIVEGHVVDRIPDDSVDELYLLGRANLMESSGVDAYRTYNFIENCLSKSEEVKCVFPFYYEPFFNILENLASQGHDVELMVPTEFLEKLDDDTKLKNISTFDDENVFLLIVTEDEMILGLFMENGFFDQNRLLTSKDLCSLLWAENLFENFKRKSK